MVLLCRGPLSAHPSLHLGRLTARRLRSLRSLRSMYAGPLEARFPAIVHRLARPIASSALPCHRSVSGADPPWIGDAYGVLARSGARGCWKSPTSSDGRGQSIASFVSFSSVWVENRKPGLTPREAFSGTGLTPREAFLESDSGEAFPVSHLLLVRRSHSKKSPKKRKARGN